MTRRKQPKPDWPAVAAALAAQISHADLHSVAMLRARDEYLRESKRGGRPSRWALAFSGGADSLALLLLFWAEGPGRWGRDFVVLHFNHRLRGKAAEADEKFCRDVCAALGVKLVVGRWNAAPRRGASEAEARAARLDFLHREMKRRRSRLLWFAHQQDDIAESMLMRLARGSGAGGLAAPRPVQAFADGRLHLRPMLTLKKAAITAALRNAGAIWREDATNSTGDFHRNRIRQAVVPAWIKAAGRDAQAGAALSRDLLEEDDAALEQWADKSGLLKRGVLDVGSGKRFPRAVLRRVLHRWLLAVRPETDLSRQGFGLLLAAIERGKDTRFSLGRGFAVIQGGRLRYRATAWRFHA
jgi:tRNA(Ile)-lysidine synthase